MKQVLFLCSGNYYRSRFAEHLFNWLAVKGGCLAPDSEGCMVDTTGATSADFQFTLEALKLLWDPAHGEPRHPKPLTLADLARLGSHWAVKEAEHRAMMGEQFPLWEKQVEYWHVDDFDCAAPKSAACTRADGSGAGGPATCVGVSGAALAAPRPASQSPGRKTVEPRP